jgi:signal transduction histidine kinase/DNA-binding response OmpR family regulator
LLPTARLRLVLLVATVASASTAGAWIWHREELARSDALMRDAHRETASLLRGILELSSERMATLATDYTFWDEMVEFARNPDPEWAAGNLEPAVGTFDVDGVFVVDLEGALLYRLPAGDGAMQELPLPAAVLARVFARDPLPRFHVAVGGAVIEVHAAEIHATADVERTGEAHGRFVVARRLDTARLAALQEVTGCTIEVVAPPSTSGPPPLVEGGRLRVDVPLLGPAGEAVAELVFRRDALAIAHLEAAADRAFAFFAAFGTLLLLIVSFGSWRFFTVPLLRISAALRGGDLARVTPILEERSEFGDLARLVRDDLEQRHALEEEIERRRESERELVLACERAEEATRARSQFVAAMSHEIRTPMTGVLGMSDLLLETSLDGKQRELAMLIHESGEALLAIVNDVLDLARMDSGRVALDERDFDFVDLVERAVLLLAPRGEAKGVDVLARIAPEVPRSLRGDDARLRQILLNLIGNAIKFTSEGEVVVGARLLERGAKSVTVAIEVRDTGIGIPPDRLTEIFEPYVQARASDARSYGGTGLGLAISKRLIELMGGRLVLESEVGRGSAFTIEATFHLADAENDHSDVMPATLRAMRVVVAAESRSLREVLREQLEAGGARVSEASSGLEIERLLVAGHESGAPIRVLLLDRQFDRQAGSDPFMLAQRLRADPRFAELRLLHVTTLDRGTLAGAQGCFDAVITRPVRRSQLFDALLDVLGEAPASKPNATLLDGEADRETLARLDVLVAEDNAINRKLIASLLARYGARATLVADGKLAIEAFERQRFDAILMDRHMPVMDGLEATSRIRKIEHERGLPRIPIFALTASTLPGDRERCIAAGMDEHLGKPISRAQLLATLAPLTQKAASRHSATR